MNILNELVNGPGYVVTKINDLKKFDELRRVLIKKMNFKDKEILTVRKKISNMNNAQINRIMINLLSLNNASEMMIESCKNIVKEVSGKKIFLQRRANTIFNLPGENQRRQWPHYELMSGISPYSFVLWAPFHDLEDEDGVFYYKNQDSIKMIRSEETKGLVNGPQILKLKNKLKPTKLKYGDAIIFNPFILHGNKDFNSNLARIACSVRFQSTLMPIMQKNSDFFKFYKIN